MTEYNQYLKSDKMEKHLQVLRDATIDKLNTKISEVNHKLQIIEMNLYSLQPLQLSIFTTILEMRETLEFFRKCGEPLEKRKDLLTGLLAGNKPGLTLLNNVIVVQYTI